MDANEPRRASFFGQKKKNKHEKEKMSSKAVFLAFNVTMA